MNATLKTVLAVLSPSFLFAVYVYFASGHKAEAQQILQNKEDIAVLRKGADSEEQHMIYIQNRLDSLDNKLDQLLMRK